jgi:hypothetical protein
LLGLVFDCAFAAAAGVDLGFHDGEGSGQFSEGGGGFVGRGCGESLRDGDACIAEQLFGLVFMDLHAGTREIAAVVDLTGREENVSRRGAEGAEIK